ncbi:MAG: PqqD family protein [Bacteroidales bacterium]|nr:PqqD family protein [Bacteroidales bacterium]
MSSEKKYIHNNETISGRLHDELVMMDIKKGKYFSLNPVATHIWDLLAQPLSLDELCLKLTDEYEVAEVQCRGEIEEHLEEMKKLGLLLMTK